MHGRGGHAWPGSVRGWGACVAEGEHAWWGGMHGSGWGGMHGGGMRGKGGHV